MSSALHPMGGWLDELLGRYLCGIFVSCEFCFRKKWGIPLGYLNWKYGVCESHWDLYWILSWILDTTLGLLRRWRLPGNFVTKALSNLTSPELLVRWVAAPWGCQPGFAVIEWTEWDVFDSFPKVKLEPQKFVGALLQQLQPQLGFRLTVPNSTRSVPSVMMTFMIFMTPENWILQHSKTPSGNQTWLARKFPSDKYKYKYNCNYNYKYKYNININMNIKIYIYI